jgi:hypothetical protein
MNLLKYRPKRKGPPRSDEGRRTPSDAAWLTHPTGYWLQTHVDPEFPDTEIEALITGSFATWPEALSAVSSALHRAGMAPNVHAPKPPRRRWRTAVKSDTGASKLMYFGTFHDALKAKLEYEKSKCEATQRWANQKYPPRPPNTPKRKGVYWTPSGRWQVHDPWDLNGKKEAYVKTYKHYEDAVRVREALYRHQPIPEDLLENTYPGLHYDADLCQWIITHDDAIMGTAPTFDMAKRMKQSLE